MIGSSSLLEFLVALTIGGLAVVGALLCIGFLLVEPIRSPPSEAPTVDLGKPPFSLLFVYLSLCISFSYLNNAPIFDCKNAPDHIWLGYMLSNACELLCKNCYIYYSWLQLVVVALSIILHLH